jgi:hypothetical protein
MNQLGDTSWRPVVKHCVRACLSKATQQHGARYEDRKDETADR